MTTDWKDVLLAIQQKVPSTTFNRWFKPLTAERFSQSELHLVADDEFDAVFIEKNFAQLIQLHLKRIVGRDLAIKVTHQPQSTDGPTTGVRIRPDSPTERSQSGGNKQKRSKASLLSEPPLKIKPAEPTPTERILDCGLKLQYSFENFVVGDSNAFANAACRTVFTHPGRIYNPLFIYGSVGLGKTHLLNAVGIELLRNDPSLRVQYTTTENFMNRLIEHLKAGRMEAFRNHYRKNVDALLVDDIQFLSGKESTKQEFFHTFNTLHQAGKQIVITSDRTPQELHDIEDRLRSRFQWGLIADIQAPSLETRLAIIERKAATLRLELESPVALYLAENIRSNIRELEGALLRLHAYAEFNKKKLTLPLAKTLLRQFLHENNRKISVDQIQKIVCNITNVRLTDLKGKSRKRDIARPRQISMYLAKKYTGLSYPQLGKKFGGRDHTTVLAAHRKIEQLITSDQTVTELVRTIEQRLLGL